MSGEDGSSLVAKCLPTSPGRRDVVAVKRRFRKLAPGLRASGLPMDGNPTYRELVGKCTLQTALYELRVIRPDEIHNLLCATATENVHPLNQPRK